MSAKIIKLRTKFIERYIKLESDKSCTNCNHLKGRSPDNFCGQHPKATLFNVNERICRPGERLLWSPKLGLLTRLSHWIF